MPNVRLSDGYFFHIRRTGKGGQRIYGENEFDIYALVALDIHAIAYFAADYLRFQTVALRVPGIQYHHDSKAVKRFDKASKAVKRFDKATFESALNSVLEDS